MKGTAKGAKRQAAGWDKIFAKHIPEKGWEDTFDFTLKFKCNCEVLA